MTNTDKPVDYLLLNKIEGRGTKLLILRLIREKLVIIPIPFRSHVYSESTALDVGNVDCRSIAGKVPLT